MPKNKKPQPEATAREQFRQKRDQLAQVANEVIRVPGSVELTVHPGDQAIFSVSINDGVSTNQILMAISIAAIDMAEQLL